MVASCVHSLNSSYTGRRTAFLVSDHKDAATIVLDIGSAALVGQGDVSDLDRTASSDTDTRD